MNEWISFIALHFDFVIFLDFLKDDILKVTKFKPYEISKKAVSKYF